MQLKRRRCKRDRHELMSAVADASQVARATSPAYGDSFRPRKLVVSTAVQQFTEAHPVDRYFLPTEAHVAQADSFCWRKVMWPTATHLVNASQRMLRKVILLMRTHSVYESSRSVRKSILSTGSHDVCIRQSCLQKLMPATDVHAAHGNSSCLRTFILQRDFRNLGNLYCPRNILIRT